MELAGAELKQCSYYAVLGFAWEGVEVTRSNLGQLRNSLKQARVCTWGLCAALTAFPSEGVA